MSAIPFVDLLAGHAPAPRSEGAQRQRSASYPSAHPHGWYHVARLDELAPGQVLAVRLLGDEVALFRTQGGEVCAIEGYCPHMGSHLAIGGTVQGDCLTCPFHGWSFRGDGRVAHVPYQQPNPRVRARSWPVTVCYGLVFLWHGPVDASGEPPYRPDRWPELDTDTYVHRGRYAPRDIGMHLTEFAENSVDVAHFPVLHGRMHIPWTRWTMPLVTVDHQADWQTDPDHPYLAYFLNDASLRFRCRPLPRSGASTVATFVGPASLVMFQITVPDVGSVLIAQTHTPLEAPGAPMRLQVRFTWWSERTMGRLLTSYIVGNWVSQWWQDVSVWENKVHMQRPKLVGNDGPVGKLRAWYQQFYAAG